MGSLHYMQDYEHLRERRALEKMLEGGEAPLALAENMAKIQMGKLRSEAEKILYGFIQSNRPFIFGTGSSIFLINCSTDAEVITLMPAFRASANHAKIACKEFFHSRSTKLYENLIKKIEDETNKAAPASCFIFDPKNKDLIKVSCRYQKEDLEIARHQGMKESISITIICLTVLMATLTALRDCAGKTINIQPKALPAKSETF